MGKLAVINVFICRQIHKHFYLTMSGHEHKSLNTFNLMQFNSADGHHHTAAVVGMCDGKTQHIR